MKQRIIIPAGAEVRVDVEDGEFTVTVGGQQEAHHVTVPPRPDRDDFLVARDDFLVARDDYIEQVSGSHAELTIARRAYEAGWYECERRMRGGTL